MTSERSRKCQESRVTSDCKEDALLGLQPFAADWHAEANYLEVCMYINNHSLLYLAPSFENTFTHPLDIFPFDVKALINVTVA